MSIGTSLSEHTEPLIYTTATVIVCLTLILAVYFGYTYSQRKDNLRKIQQVQACETITEQGLRVACLEDI